MKTLTATTAAALLVTAIGGAAFARDGGESLDEFNELRAEARAAGGYGNPFVAVPAAIADAMTGAAEAMTEIMIGDGDGSSRTGREGAEATGTGTATGTE